MPVFISIKGKQLLYTDESLCPMHLPRFHFAPNQDASLALLSPSLTDSTKQNSLSTLTLAHLLKKFPAFCGAGSITISIVFIATATGSLNRSRIRCN
jgi:hypothetical protein